MTTETKTAKIVALEASNVKRLKAVRIEPDGELVVIGGNNNQGKSCVLDSILWALGGAKHLPEKPIREGEKAAKIELQLDTDPPLIVRRVITDSGRTTLEVRQQVGKATPKLSSPQAILDPMVGKIAFDPLAFTHETPARQVEILKELCGADTTEIDALIAEAFEQRAEAKRQLASAQHELDAADPCADAPEKEIQVDQLLLELKHIEIHNTGRVEAIQEARESRGKLESAYASRDSAAREIAELKTTLNGRLKAYEEMDVAIQAMEAAHEALSTAAEKMQHKDDQLIREKIANAENVNARVRGFRAYSAMENKVKGLRDVAAEDEMKVAALRERRADLLSKADWPVDGLSFGEHGIEYNGFPMDQLSSSDQLKISVAISVAQNPTLPIMLIRDGSLLDSDSLAYVGKLAAERGAQVWVERVSRGDECTVIIEDGEVAE